MLNTAINKISFTDNNESAPLVAQNNPIPPASGLVPGADSEGVDSFTPEKKKKKTGLIKLLVGLKILSTVIGAGLIVARKKLPGLKGIKLEDFDRTKFSGNFKYWVARGADYMLAHFKKVKDAFLKIAGKSEVTPEPPPPPPAKGIRAWFGRRLQWGKKK